MPGVHSSQGHELFQQPFYDTFTMDTTLFGHHVLKFFY